MAHLATSAPRVGPAWLPARASVPEETPPFACVKAERVEKGAGRRRALIDLQAWTVQNLPSLDGLDTYNVDGQRWVTLATLGRTEEHKILALDLQNGMVRSILEWTGKRAINYGAGSTSADGRFTIFGFSLGRESTSWLLDAATGTSRELPSTGQLSLDGRWLAIEQRLPEDSEAADPPLMIMATDGDEPWPLAERGRYLIWVPSV